MPQNEHYRRHHRRPDPFYLPLLRGIEDVASEHGTLVLIADSRDSTTLADAMIRRLIARGVDGIIAVAIDGLDGGRESASALPPIVYVDQPDRMGYVLLFDGHQAGSLATSHLAEHRHDRIAIVTPPRSWPNVNEVYRGYVDALERLAGDSPRPLVSEVSEFSVDAGRLGLVQLLESPELPSAVFAVDEVLALGVLREARARGIDVPGDLALLGYTDSPVSTLVDPVSRWCRCRRAKSARRQCACSTASSADAKPRRRRRVLDVELVIRDSCGPHASLDAAEETADAAETGQPETP